MSPREYCKSLEAENKQLRALLTDAQTALRDLGACDDPECSEQGCLRVLQRIHRVLEIDPLEPPAEKPKRYGCKSDPWLQLEECVIFTDPGQCTLAAKLLSDGKTREDCPYWREIEE